MHHPFQPQVGANSVTTLFSLGYLLLLKLENDPFHESPEKDWFCSEIVMKTPEEDEILFPDGYPSANLSS